MASAPGYEPRGPGFYSRQVSWVFFVKGELPQRSPGFGLICAEGDLWKDQRKFVSSSLKNFGMVRFGPKRDKMEERIAVGVKECVEKLSRLTSPCDPQPALLHCLGNVVNSLVFGHTWSEDDPTWLWLQHLQEEGTKLIGVAGPINFLPFLRVFPEYKKTMRFLMEGKEKTHVVYDNMIRERKKRGEGSGPGDDMIDAFLAEMSRRQASGRGDEGFYTVSQFHHLLADLFGAGVDTTLTTLRWFLLFMAQNPDVQTRVQEELDGVLQGRPLTLEDAAVLPYTEATLAETQRIRSVVPLGIPHGALEDTELAGYHIPRGAMLVPLQWAVHMDPKLWPEPDRFNPGRFLTEDDRFYKPEAFIPFQTGKRICVGEELGRMLLFLFGATIVHQFRVSPPDGAPLDLEGDVGITLTPRPQSLLFTARFETTR
uniref:Cytochrome P450 n=1 Tax=Timema poppense TaxID=170557 RepID=A0A7R9CNU4_TIMPO|nr:unnamed protein product [Timema poppensis]